MVDVAQNDVIYDKLLVSGHLKYFHMLLPLLEPLHEEQWRTRQDKQSRFEMRYDQRMARLLKTTDVARTIHVARLR